MNEEFLFRALVRKGYRVYYTSPKGKFPQSINQSINLLLLLIHSCFKKGTEFNESINSKDGVVAAWNNLWAAVTAKNTNVSNNLESIETV